VPGARPFNAARKAAGANRPGLRARAEPHPIRFPSGPRKRLRVSAAVPAPCLRTFKAEMKLNF